MIMKNLFVKLATSAISRAVRLSGSSTLFLLNLWGRVTREPISSNKFFYHVLLLKVETEQRSSDFLERLNVSAGLELPLHALQLEHPAGCKSHSMEAVEGSRVEEEEVAYASLDYYCTQEIPGTLAVVRYTVDVDVFGGMCVSERAYPDRPEGFCDLQEDVPEALSAGIDVCVMSHVDPEILPEINAFLKDVGTEV